MKELTLQEKIEQRLHEKEEIPIAWVKEYNKLIINPQANKTQ
uniref:Uncharacterized protein n=1 Tax=viral metagenome TaxID=1070528 RepID=A0A6M3KBX0_9ZZZZ